MIKIKNIICPNCGQENSNTNIKCTKCGAEINSINDSLTIKEDPKDKEKAKKAIIIIGDMVPLISALPFIVFGLIAAVLTTNMNHERNKAPDNYLTTTGYLLSTSCSDNNSCSATYTYTINDITYSKPPNIQANKSSFPKKTEVKYDQNNPSNSVVQYSSWTEYYVTYMSIISGIIVFVIEYHTTSKKYHECAVDYY